MKNIKAVVFDYSGVIEISSRSFLPSILAELGVEKEKWQEVYFANNRLTNVENLAWKDVALLVSQKLGANEKKLANIGKIIDEYDKEKNLNLELLEVIKRLRNLGYKTGVLSNFTTVLRDRIKEQGISEFFDVIVVSSDVGYQKPEPEIFTELFNRLNLEAENVVFIDDAKRSLSSAESVGYTPILYKDNETLFEQLSDLLGVKL